MDATASPQPTNINASGTRHFIHPTIGDTSVPCPYRREPLSALDPPQNATGSGALSPQSSTVPISMLPSSVSSASHDPGHYPLPSDQLTESYSGYRLHQPTGSQPIGWDALWPPDGGRVSDSTSTTPHPSQPNVGLGTHGESYIQPSMAAWAESGDSTWPTSLDVPSILTTMPDGQSSRIIPAPTPLSHLSTTSLYVIFDY